MSISRSSAQDLKRLMLKYYPEADVRWLDDLHEKDTHDEWRELNKDIMGDTIDHIMAS